MRSIHKLICKKNLKKLGIKKDNGSWDLKKFEEHLKECKVCRHFALLIYKHLFND